VTYRFIDAEKDHHRVARLCGVLRISRSGYYAWQRRGASERSAQDVVLAARISAIHSESDGTYGVPRVHAELRDQGILDQPPAGGAVDARAGPGGCQPPEAAVDHHPRRAAIGAGSD
jgi:hypothetical protein